MEPSDSASRGGKAKREESMGLRRPQPLGVGGSLGPGRSGSGLDGTERGGGIGVRSIESRDATRREGNE